MSTSGIVQATLLKMASNAATPGADALAMQRRLKLQDAAEKFEGMMLQELLKPLQESQDSGFTGLGSGFGTGEDDRDDTLDTISSFGTEAVANAIAKQGGLGIAKQVMRQIGALDPVASNGAIQATKNPMVTAVAGTASNFSHKGGVPTYNPSPKVQNGSLDEKAKKKS
jgi:flagellar protein FlgJ